MPDLRSSDPLHGITLEMILTQLVERYGWDEMGKLSASDVLIMTRVSNPA